MKGHYSIQMTLSAVLFVSSMLSSCGSDDGSSDAPTPSPNKPTETLSGKGHYFLGVKTDDGSEFVMQAESIERGDLDVKDNIFELPQREYTWIFRDDIAIGLVYQQQFAGIGYAMQYVSESEPFKQLGEFRITTRYSNYGFFGNWLLTSVAGQVSEDGSRNDGATFAFWNIGSEGVSLDHTKTIWTETLTWHGEQQVTFSSIVDKGDGTFLSAMVQSAFNQTGTGNGSSVGDVKYPDSVWVVHLDAELNVLHIYRDDRISYAAGQYRSQVFPEVLSADDGTVYVFSNAFNEKTTRRAAALRINKGEKDFDADYYFDLQTPANGYKFRRVWHIEADKYLLEIYNEPKPTSTGLAHQFAIVSMSDKNFKWITGLPAKNLITSGQETGGVPLSHGGKVYLPITQYGQDATIYVIDPETAVATKGITVKGVKEIRTIGYMK